jgi:putative addiction module component (TIGR02574 family)
MPLGPIADLADAERKELERRWTAFQQDPEEGESWEDVKAELIRET